jgi:hypothetical protein
MYLFPGLVSLQYSQAHCIDLVRCFPNATHHFCCQIQAEPQKLWWLASCLCATTDTCSTQDITPLFVLSCLQSIAW